MEAVPTFDDLASIDTATLLRLWSGLWFNSRALRLRECAKKILETGLHISWDIPTRNFLLSLPWIGSYTSWAILAFVYNQDVSVVDTNIRRVLLWELCLDPEMSMKEIQVLAKQCVPVWKANDWYNALMDYGSLVATAKATGIKPLSKQSRFVGSDRQVRWWILKQLSAHKSLSFSTVQHAFPKKNVSKIVLWLAKDKMIRMEGDYIFFEV